jgi:ATP-binding cassette, subfamily B, multidrug efflux pump
MIKLLRYLKKREWLDILSALVFIVAQVYLDLKMPDYMENVTMIATGSGSGDINDILINGAWMLLCALGSLVAAFVTGFFVSRLGAGFSYTLRDELNKKVQSFSSAEIQRFSTSSLITRCTNDVTQVQSLMTMGLQLLIKAPITAVWAILKILNKEWEWTVATAVTVVFVLVSVIIIIALVYRTFQRMQNLTDNLNSVTRESLTGIRVVRAYNAEGEEEKKFGKANDEYTHSQRYGGNVLAFLSPVMSLSNSGLSLAIYWIGAYVISAASLMNVATLYSDMVVFVSYASQVVMAFMMLVIIFMIAPRAIVSARRIEEVLSTKPSILDGAGVGETEKKGELSFQNVSFTYPGAKESVISNISFSLKQGQTLAIVGATGSGKSTIVSLLSRFYDVTSGAILLDGAPLTSYTLEELNKKIAYVSQKAILFSGNVENNINFGDNEASSATLEEAVEVSQSAEFLTKKDGVYADAVAEGGSNFSGGQKQRISIARALARKAEIYVFDDSFSALDFETERKLRSELRHSMASATEIVVAQRVGTIKDADDILVLEGGKIVGEGRHHDLLKSCPTYREICESQLSKEELENA